MKEEGYIKRFGGRTKPFSIKRTGTLRKGEVSQWEQLGPIEDKNTEAGVIIRKAVTLNAPGGVKRVRGSDAPGSG